MSRDFEAAAEIADMLGHPFPGLGGIAVANGGHDALLRGGDPRGGLRHLVDHGAERRHEQLHQRLVRQHENAVVGGFAHGMEEFRRLFNGAARVDILADCATRASRSVRSAGLRWRAAAAAIGGSSAVSASQMS